MIIDISRTLSSGIAVWPGDDPYQIITVGSRAEGSSVNVTRLNMGAHTGSHMDAPYHFADEGATVETLDLSIYWGLAQVVTVTKEGGLLTPDDFAEYDLSLAPRLLVHSPVSELDPSRFPDQYPHPDSTLADVLGKKGVLLYGSDSPSMDDVNSKLLPGHNALLRNGIHILEGLDLSGVEDGLYELVALPLKIAGGDGSPIRAALRTLDTE